MLPSRNPCARNVSTDSHDRADGRCCTPIGVPPPTTGETEFWSGDAYCSAGRDTPKAIGSTNVVRCPSRHMSSLIASATVGKLDTFGRPRRLVQACKNPFQKCNRRFLGRRSGLDCLALRRLGPGKRSSDLTSRTADRPFSQYLLHFPTPVDSFRTALGISAKNATDPRSPDRRRYL